MKEIQLPISDPNSLLRKVNTSLFIVDNDQQKLFYFLITFWIAWTLSVGLLPLSIVLDSVEEVVWSQTWQWGYYKHPPLPSILMAGLNRLLNGPSMWLTIFAAQGCAVIALIYVWLLAKKILPPKLAIVAVLITSLIGYHNYGATSYDHNTVSLPFSAAILYYFYCATRRPERLFNWLILGVAAGLGMLTKYSALLVLTGGFVYLMLQRRWSNPYVIRGLFVSSSIFFLVFSPHLFWLKNHDWLPFTYLKNELTPGNSRLDILSRFFTGQVLPLLPILLGVLLLRKTSPRNLIITDSPEYLDQNDDWRFLMVTLFTPLILALLPPLINGTFVSRNWVAAFFLPTGIAIVKCFFGQHDHVRLLQNTVRIAWSIQTIILLAFIIGKIIYPTMTGNPVRTNFPSRLLAERASIIWHEHQQQPLTIVIADTWLGGNVLLHTRPEPTVLLNNDLAISTWVNHQDVADCGALVLTTAAEKNLPAYTVLFNHAAATGTFSLRWGDLPHEYAWAILSPEPNHSTCRFAAA